jgi:hypothetical protein
MGVKNRRFLLVVFYEGPWDRLQAFCYGIRKDGSLRYEIPLNPRGWRRLLGEIGAWADRRDVRWREKYAVSGKMPHPRWRR